MELMELPVSGASRCAAVKADGTPCRAFALRDGDLCAGHAGIGLAANPREAGLKGCARSAEVRAERAEIRKRGVRQVLAEAVEEEFLPAIKRAYGRGLESDDPSIAVRSAEALLSRVYGKPKETIVDNREVPADFQAVRDMTSEQREKLYVRLMERQKQDDLEAEGGETGDSDEMAG
jgi:hypothetical protein